MITDPREVDVGQQAQVFFDAISEAVHAVAKKINDDGEALILNSILSAYATALARHLASIDDEGLCQTVFSQIGDRIIELVDSYRGTGKHPSSYIVCRPLQ